MTSEREKAVNIGIVRKKVDRWPISMSYEQTRWTMNEKSDNQRYITIRRVDRTVLWSRKKEFVLKNIVAKGMIKPLAELPLSQVY